MTSCVLLGWCRVDPQSSVCWAPCLWPGLVKLVRSEAPPRGESSPAPGPPLCPGPSPYTGPHHTGPPPPCLGAL